MAPPDRLELDSGRSKEFVYRLGLAGELRKRILIEYDHSAAGDFVPQEPQTLRRRLIQIEVEVHERESQARPFLEQRGNRLAHIAFHDVNSFRDRRIRQV